MPLLLATATARMRCGLANIACSGAAAQQIEVERKFQPPTDLAELDGCVEAQGGRKLGEKRFTDTYYDTSKCALTRRDVWLRLREGAWEVKLPLEGDAKRSGGERTVFREVEGAEAVNVALRDLLTASGATLDETLRVAELRPFAEFSTTRSQWQVGKASLDADVASFGHAVMEIEVLCADASEVAAAEEEIARVAALVGAKPLEKSLGGKLETYIRRHAPDVLEALVEEGILKPV